MRCPNCRHDQKYQDGMTCQKCRYQFVFDPKSDNFHDSLIYQMVQQLSDNGQYYFTKTQLVMEIYKYRHKKESSSFGCLISAIFFGIIVAAILFETIGTFGSLGFGVIIIIAIIWIRLPKKWSILEAKKAIGRYHQIHPIEHLVDGKAFIRIPEARISPVHKIHSLDSIEQLADGKAIITMSGDMISPANHQIQSIQQPLVQKTAALQSQESVLNEFFFSPERILIVERDDIVDMLIRNHFHQNTKTVVVSQSGYPEFVFTACQHFLKKNPNLPVQVLHGISTEGFRMTNQLRNDAKWQFARSNLVELGISREDIAENKSSLPWACHINQDIIFSQKYNKMLTKNRHVPIDYVPPNCLLRALSGAVISDTLLLVALEEASHISYSYESYG